MQHTLEQPGYKRIGISVKLNWNVRGSTILQIMLTNGNRLFIHSYKINSNENAVAVHYCIIRTSIRVSINRAFEYGVQVSKRNWLQSALRGIYSADIMCNQKWLNAMLFDVFDVYNLFKLT